MTEPNIINLKTALYYETILQEYKYLSNIYKNINRTTKNKNIPLRKSKNKVGQKCYTYIAIECFNALDNKLKSLILIKNHYKEK